MILAHWTGGTVSLTDAQRHSDHSFIDRIVPTHKARTGSMNIPLYRPPHLPSLSSIFSSPLPPFVSPSPLEARTSLLTTASTRVLPSWTSQLACPSARAKTIRSSRMSFFCLPSIRRPFLLSERRIKLWSFLLCQAPSRMDIVRVAGE